MVGSYRFQWLPGYQFQGFGWCTKLTKEAQFLWKISSFCCYGVFSERHSICMKIRAKPPWLHGFFSWRPKVCFFSVFPRNMDQNRLVIKMSQWAPAQFLDLDTCLKWSWFFFQPKTWTNFLALAKSTCHVGGAESRTCTTWACGGPTSGYGAETEKACPLVYLGIVLRYHPCLM